MKNSIKRLTTLAMALTLIAASSGMVMAAPGSIDGSQTDTQTEVYVVADKTMDTDFNASGDTTWNMTLQSVPETADLAMNVSHAGEDYYSHSGTFSQYDDGDPDADATTIGMYHTFTDDELGDVPMAINENVTLNVTYWDTTADSPTPTTIQVEVQNNEERSVAEVTADSAFADVEEENRWVRSDYNYTTLDDTRDVAGSNTTVIYRMTDSEVTDTFANATEGIEDTGAFTLMQADAEGADAEQIPVWYKSAPSWYDAADHGSYAVYDPGEDTLTYTLSSENFDGQSMADLSANSDAYGVGDVYTVFKLGGGWDNDGMSAVFTLANPMN